MGEKREVANLHSLLFAVSFFGGPNRNYSIPDNINNY